MVDEEWIFPNEKIGIADVVLLVHFLRPSYNYLPGIVMVNIFYLSMSIKQLINTALKDAVYRKAFLSTLLLCFAVTSISGYAYFRWVWFW